MKVKHFFTTGNNDIKEVIWEKPQHTSTQIVVQNIMTGICSSDVDMYKGKFTALPKDIQGHEGLAKVIEVGKKVKNVKVGDYVATRGEPAFADVYNVNDNEFVVVPEASPKYILEPVACAVNIADAVGNVSDKSVCIIGSGFMARVIYQTLVSNKNKNINVTVLGNAYHSWWKKQNVNIVKRDNFKPQLETYDIVIDLTDSPLTFNPKYLNTNGIYVIGAEKTVERVNFAEFLWKNCSILCPSPRSVDFYSKMKKAKDLISSGEINVDDMWTKSYNRDLAEEAFKNRATGKDKGRTYLSWQL